MRLSLVSKNIAKNSKKNAQMLIPVITVDGPGGSGKGTISLRLAKKLNWEFLDSGALYRALAFALMKHQKKNRDNILSPIHIQKLAENLNVQFIVHADKSVRIIFEDQDITAEIRSSDCADKASQISVLPIVRQALLARQRAFCKMPGLVADGRDMGTVVFPQASLKIFLTASLEARAKRRYNELQAKNINVSLERVLAELAERDRRDAERAAAPLKPAPSAWMLDTTELTADQAFEQVCQWASGIYI